MLFCIIPPRGASACRTTTERQVDLAARLVRSREVTWWNEHRSAPPWSGWTPLVVPVLWVKVHHHGDPWSPEREEVFGPFYGDRDASKTEALWRRRCPAAGVSIIDESEKVDAADNEAARLAGMAFGAQGYNDTMGY
tara:strand:- start:18 stop:428 length:411 start_codon:yes stop_codon:yes gene_type:complete